MIIDCRWLKHVSFMIRCMYLHVNYYCHRWNNMVPADMATTELLPLLWHPYCARKKRVDVDVGRKAVWTMVSGSLKIQPNPYESSHCFHDWIFWNRFDGPGTSITSNLRSEPWPVHLAVVCQHFSAFRNFSLLFLSITIPYWPPMISWLSNELILTTPIPGVVYSLMHQLRKTWINCLQGTAAKIWRDSGSDYESSIGSHS